MGTNLKGNGGSEIKLKLMPDPLWLKKVGSKYPSLVNTALGFLLEVLKPYLEGYRVGILDPTILSRRGSGQPDPTSQSQPVRASQS